MKYITLVLVLGLLLDIVQSRSTVRGNVKGSRKLEADTATAQDENVGEPVVDDTTEQTDEEGKDDEGTENEGADNEVADNEGATEGEADNEAELRKKGRSSGGDSDDQDDDDEDTNDSSNNGRNPRNKRGQFTVVEVNDGGLLPDIRFRLDSSCSDMFCVGDILTNQHPLFSQNRTVQVGRLNQNCHFTTPVELMCTMMFDLESEELGVGVINVAGLLKFATICDDMAVIGGSGDFAMAAGILQLCGDPNVPPDPRIAIMNFNLD